MKKVLLLLFIISATLFSQEDKIPEGWDKITLNGKVAYMNLITGDVSKTLPKKAAKKIEVVPEFEPTVIHYVKKGETLSIIARNYNKTLAEMYRLNSLTDFDTLEIGDEVVVGYREENKPTDSYEENKANYHTVKSGETLYRISVNYGISVQELKRLNSLTSNTISVGQRLVVN